MPLNQAEYANAMLDEPQTGKPMPRVGAQGTVAHDQPIQGHPVRIGGRAVTANVTGVATNDAVDFISTVVGVQIQKPYSIPELDWQFACTAAITGTADTAVKAAAGAGIRNYVTCFQLINTHATVGTEVVVKDGSTVIWRGYLPPNMGNMLDVQLPTPLKGSANAIINFACITTGANVYVSAQGYAAP